MRNPWSEAPRCAVGADRDERLLSTVPRRPAADIERRCRAEARPRDRLVVFGVNGISAGRRSQLLFLTRVGELKSPDRSTVSKPRGAHGSGTDWIGRDSEQAGDLAEGRTI